MTLSSDIKPLLCLITLFPMVSFLTIEGCSYQKPESVDTTLTNTQAQSVKKIEADKEKPKEKEQGKQKEQPQTKGQNCDTSNNTPSAPERETDSSQDDSKTHRKEPTCAKKQSTSTKASARARSAACTDNCDVCEWDGNSYFLSFHGTYCEHPGLEGKTYYHGTYCEHYYGVIEPDTATPGTQQDEHLKHPPSAESAP